MYYWLFAFKARGSAAIIQGVGMLMAGGMLTLLSLLFFPVVFFSGGLVIGGFISIIIGVFTLGGGDSGRYGSRGARSPVDYYVALPEEMPAGYCWQCGKRVKADSFICLRCGATQPKVAQQRPMISAPTMDRANESGQWPQWQEGEPPQGPGPMGPMGPMGPGGFPGGAPYPPGAPYPQGAPYPGGAQYPPPPFPPQNMPNMPYPGPGYPAFPLPSQGPYPGRGPSSGGPYPGGPFRPGQGQASAQGKQPRQKKRSRPQAQR